jgi:hypothetical protein
MIHRITILTTLVALARSDVIRRVEGDSPLDLIRKVIEDVGTTDSFLTAFGNQAASIQTQGLSNSANPFRTYTPSLNTLIAT